MIKKRDVHESQALFELMTHPDVYPYVRQKATSSEELLFMIKQMIEAEERGELISRTILDEWGNPAGTISLFDVQNNSGFLGTWLGKPYHGLGYNQAAKEAFFNELFFELGIENVYLRIRKTNLRSQKAAEKLPYVVLANETNKALYDEINKEENLFNLYVISRDLYTLVHMRTQGETENALEA
ncbi:alanine acetyltransferase [Jeotgalibacillus malaysiensis]|uniref:Alanine acetyltransferase n=1 Tax=Jeotgalibacillus malaysiensis TaxID=1508404 RepID=A0A0B5ALS9_9BACL|nr:GNAT family N-acetyltransferase [Jeotgalibacillus malaysiensis]AJD91210.1 alanine acetyltransferase [Jeotgalibacillus malaysiensis]